MTDSVKATRATVQIGSFPVDGFMLPNGSYRMSLTQAAECIGVTDDLFQSFLKSKDSALDAWDGYEVETVMVEGNSVKVIPLPLASAFWMYRSFVLKDIQALQWVMTLT